MVSSTGDCICQQGRIELIVQKSWTSCSFFLALAGGHCAFSSWCTGHHRCWSAAGSSPPFCEDLRLPNIFFLPPKTRGGRGTKDFPGRDKSNTKSKVSTKWIHQWEIGFGSVTRLCRIFYKQHYKLQFEFRCLCLAMRNQEPLAQKNPEALDCSIKIYGHPKLSRSAHFRLKFVTTHLKTFADLEVTHKTKWHRVWNLKITESVQEVGLKTRVPWQGFWMWSRLEVHF